MASMIWQLRNNGGFTVGLGRNDPRIGFAVGGGSWCHKVDSYDIRPEAVEGWLERLREVAYLEGERYLGGWDNDERWHVEPVDVTALEYDALNIARGRGEAAIFNLATGETIAVD